MSSFELKYTLLSSSEPELGKVAIIPWDSEIFGFKVGQYEPGDSNIIDSNKDRFSSQLKKWANAHDVRLIGCCFSSKRTELISIVQNENFHFVDFRLKISLNNLQKVNLPNARFKIRTIVENDHDAIKRIAMSSFHDGRYHADFRFPKKLADLRYSHWIDQALTSNEASTKIFSIDVKGVVKGFFHIELENGVGDLRLAAVDPDSQTGILGYYLYLGVIKILKENGVKKLTGVISASNVPVLNVLTSLGFVCTGTNLMFHRYLNFEK